jgi:hypothetical protein
MSSVPERRQADRLLERIRALVAELRRLEQARADRRELQRRRREITRLQWQLAPSSAGTQAAATSPPEQLRQPESWNSAGSSAASSTGSSSTRARASKYT